MHSSPEFLSFLFQLLGLILEILGVLGMANAYLAVAQGSRSKLSLLLDALFRGPRARGANRLQEAGFNAEDRLRVLQGLGLIGLGFLFQAIGLILPYLLPSTS